MPVNWEAISAIGQLVGALAVVISLIYLASEVRRNTRAKQLGAMRSMSDADFSRRLMHPENGPMTLDNVLGLYGWHGRHHTAHITSLRERKGW